MQYVAKIRTSASEERLAKLMEMRLQPGVDKDAIDKRIWDLFGEEWAVLFTDLAGFSRNVVEFGIVHFLQVIFESERIFVPCIDAHDGFLLKTEGDSMLVIFRNVAKAIGCAVDMQRATREYNGDKSEEEQIHLCAGLGHGPVLRIGDHDVFGAQVNAASKLGEDTAEAGEILVTESVRASAESMELSFEPIDARPPGAEAAYRLVYAL